MDFDSPQPTNPPTSPDDLTPPQPPSPTTDSFSQLPNSLPVNSPTTTSVDSTAGPSEALHQQPPSDFSTNSTNQPASTVFNPPPLALNPEPNFVPPQTVNPPKKKRKKLKILLIILFVLGLLGGGGALAYYKVILPSKPENKFVSALLNTARQQQMTISGTVEVTPATGQSQAKPSSNVSYKLSADLTKHNFSLSGTFGMTGLQFPFDVRYLDRDTYFKIGGLSSLSKLIPASASSSPVSSAALYLNLLSKVSDQWYVVDHSLLSSSPSANCVTNTSLSLNSADISIVKKAYAAHPLFSVKSTSKVQLNGEQVTKLELTPTSDPEAAAFAKDSSGLSVVTNIKKCLSSSGINTSQAATHVMTNAQETSFVYINGNDQLRKLEVTSTENKVTTAFTANFDYSPVTITKPDGAKPIQDLLSTLLGPLYTNSNGGAGSLSGLLP